MGRHSRRGPAPQGSPAAAGPAEPEASGSEGAGEPAAPAYQGVPAGSRAPQGAGPAAGPGTGRRRRGGRSDGTPPHGTPRAPEEAAREVRGGHPEQREPGGGWGARGDGRPSGARPGGRTGGGGGAVPASGSAGATGRKPADGSGPKPVPAARVPGPRREYLAAFGAASPADRGASSGAAGDAPARPATTAPAAGTPGAAQAAGRSASSPPPPGSGANGVATDKDPAPRGAGKGRTITGIAAAAVTTVLAVVVAGQVTGAEQDRGADRAAGEASGREGADGPASRSDGRPAPPLPAPALPAPTYPQLMSRQFPLDPKLKGSGAFTAVPGFDKAPGTGRKVRYRVDVEKGLGLDGKLFATAVQRTLNDKRSWAHGGAMTFERVATGAPDFVITLASPGTTGVWCAKSGLDTTVDNVSCDSAATDRVMINAYRWAQGSVTFGAKAMHPYRQMLINHEVGHRLGHDHVSCRTPGALAPVMQQQTKSLKLDGIACRPNPWVYPSS
ncbi:DUF3152 domain-containing protein [Streptomyces sp. LP05-1]|uniref:DUF3152 domain-containing protein n=1 Tax=Streptomyces pyxinae TaxID=2970734 RepID=A0ABT2CAJ6_9ACTN|nr:DUF3152 domain-containing protein [Streptomyces sp. LP05-1]MCS0634409.1 DUF3152 domain-containing protein [Streptomyces sp. LP05-1]